MEISRDGTVLATESFTPQYETHRPNGEGCEPVCRNATLEAALAAFE